MREIIDNHLEILSQPEVQKLSSVKLSAYGAIWSNILIVMPLSAYVFYKSRSQAGADRTRSYLRIFLYNTISLGYNFYVLKQESKMFDELSAKYLGQLNDNELQNFEFFYQQKKAMEL